MREVQKRQRILRRAKDVAGQCAPPLNRFINEPLQNITLDQFCSIDDADVLMAIKIWRNHPDKILSYLCRGITDRQLLKVKYSAAPADETLLQQKKKETALILGISPEDIEWLVFTGIATSHTYDFENKNIKILFKNGCIKDISEVDDALINESLRGDLKKYYICYPGFNQS